MKIHIPVVLFFTLAMLPTEEELKAGLAARARFRNATLDDGKVEKCDFVMGAVPPQYADVPRYGEESDKAGAEKAEADKAEADKVEAAEAAEAGKGNKKHGKK